MKFRLSNRLHFLLSAVVLVNCPFGTSFAKDFNDSEVGHIEYPGWFKNDPFTDLSLELDNAREDGKHGLMVLFTTEGCSYCYVFIRRSLGDPELASFVQENFYSMGLEIFDDTDMTDPRGSEMSIKQFAKREGVEFSPTLLFYGDGGDRVLRVVGYQSPERFKIILNYVIGNHFRSESLGEYFNRLAKRRDAAFSVVALKQDPLFSNPPFALERNRFPASSPLLVIFETSGCSECEDFHTNVLELEEIRKVLARFEIVRLDAADKETPVRTPNGTRINPASWFEQNDFTRVPALMFFDEHGNTVLKTDALVLRQRMLNSMHYVLERAYEKGWTYQRFARSKGIERRLKEQESNQ
jgi:thioredoxin-related protein